MRILKLVVRSGQTRSHPCFGYSNLQTGVTVEAELEKGDDWEAVARELRVKADLIDARHMGERLDAAIIEGKLKGGYYDDGDREEL